MRTTPVSGNIGWGPAGDAWAIFRVGAHRSSQGLSRLIPALVRVGAPAALLYGRAADPWAVCLGLGARGMGAAAGPVLRAASGAFLGPFGVPAPGPGPRTAAAFQRAAHRLAAALEDFSLSEGEAGLYRSCEIWREVKGCGYAVADDDGRPRYRAHLVARPSGEGPVAWPVPDDAAPFRACLSARPGGKGTFCAFFLHVDAPDVVSLGDAAANLQRLLRAGGWDVVRPGSGQLALAAAMVPGAANPRLPGSLFFPVPPSPEGPGHAPSRLPVEASGWPDAAASGPLVLRVTRGPRRGLMVPLDGALDIGRGGAGLDLADDEVASRHVQLQAGSHGASVRCAHGLTVQIDREPGGGDLCLRPGSSLGLGGCELVLLRMVPVRSAPEESASGTFVLEVSVRNEGDGREWNIALEAPMDARVGDVLPGICAYLGLPERRPHCLYSVRDGALLAPECPWRSAGIARGDILVVGRVAPGPCLPSPVDRVVAVAPTGGLLPLSRPPRTLEPPRPHRVELPAVPQETSFRARGGHWQMAAGAGLGLTAIAGGLLFHAQLWMAVAGGCTSLFSVTAGLMGDCSRRRHEERAFHDRVRALDGELQAVVGRQKARWDDLEPEPAAVRSWVQVRSERLWERRPADADFLRLRIGTGERRPLLTMEGRAPSGRPGELLAQALRRHAVVESAPVCLPGCEAPLVGVAGPEEPVEGLARWVLLQAAALHAPRDLSIAVLATTPRWGWAGWLPHTGTVGGAAVALDPERADTLARSLVHRPAALAGDGPWTLVLVDADAASRPAVAPLLEMAEGTRTITVVLSPDSRALPSRAAAVVALGREGGVLTGAGAEGAPRSFRPDCVGADQAAETARAMAPLSERGWRPPNLAGGLGLLDLLGIADPAAADAGQLWRRGA
jgi:hypothetical protein